MQIEKAVDLDIGAGFYDRFLDGVTFPKILVCYKELMMDQVPTEEHDILMDQVICDEK